MLFKPITVVYCVLTYCIELLVCHRPSLYEIGFNSTFIRREDMYPRLKALGEYFEPGLKVLGITFLGECFYPVTPVVKPTTAKPDVAKSMSL